MTGIGGMHHDCDFCLAVGWVTEGNENENTEEKDLDQGALNNRQGERKRDRKAARVAGSEEVQSNEQLQKEQVNVG